MENLKVTVSSEVRRRLDAAGFSDAEVKVLLAPIAKIAAKRRRFFAGGSLLTGTLAAIICVKLFMDGGDLWPTGSLAACLTSLAFAFEWGWVATQYRKPDKKLSGVMNAPAFVALLSIADDIASERLEFNDGSSGPLPLEITKNRYFVLLLSADPRLRALVRLPWGRHIDGPLTLHSTSRPSSLLNRDEKRANASCFSEEAAVDDPTAPPVQPNIASLDLNKLMDTPDTDNKELPNSKQAAVAPEHEPTKKPRRGRVSNAVKRRYWTDLSKDQLKIAVENFIDNNQIPPDHSERYHLAAETIWQAFCDNMRDDYQIAHAVRAASEAVKVKFSRVALTASSNDTDDLETLEQQPRQRKKASPDSDAWIRAMAYGTNERLVVELILAGPQLPMDLPIIKTLSSKLA